VEKINYQTTIYLCLFS